MHIRVLQSSDDSLNHRLALTFVFNTQRKSMLAKAIAWEGTQNLLCQCGDVCASPTQMRP